MWNPKHDTMLKVWKCQAFVNMWCFFMSGHHYKFLNDALTYPVIIISSVSSVTIFISSSYAAYIVMGVLSVITAILTGIMIEMRPGEKADEFMELSKRCVTFIRIIDQCLNLPTHLRADDPEIFFAKIQYEIENIENSIVLPPRRVMKSFEQKFGKYDELMYGEDIINLMLTDIKNLKAAKEIMTEQISPKFSSSV